jgi:hypothetical protein
MTEEETMIIAVMAMAVFVLGLAFWHLVRTPGPEPRSFKCPRCGAYKPWAWDRCFDCGGY